LISVEHIDLKTHFILLLCGDE